MLLHDDVINISSSYYVINRGEYVITFFITCNMYAIRDVIRYVIRDAPH
jgi:hypothetical protein